MSLQQCSRNFKRNKAMWNSCRNCSESGNSAEVLTEEIWKLADVIQVMTVHPGRDGQHFIEDTLDKIKISEDGQQIPESGRYRS